MLMQSSITCQDVEMMFGQSISLETVLPGVPNQAQLALLTIPNASLIQILLRLVRDQGKNFLQFPMDLWSSIVKED